MTFLATLTHPLFHYYQLRRDKEYPLLLFVWFSFVVLKCVQELVVGKLFCHRCSLLRYMGRLNSMFSCILIFFLSICIPKLEFSINIFYQMIIKIFLKYILYEDWYYQRYVRSLKQQAQNCHESTFYGSSRWICRMFTCFIEIVFVQDY